MEKEAPSPSSTLQENENWGPGLFLSKEAQASFDAAYPKIGMLLQAEGIAPVLPNEALCSRLLEACRHYWNDYQYDMRIPLVEIRDDIGDIVKGVDVLLPALNKLSDEACARLEFELKPSKAAGDKLVPKLRAELERLRSVSASIVRYRGAKKGSSRTSVLICCARLMELRSQLTGRPFSKTWTAKPGEGSSVEAFTGRDAQFVLDVIKAVDGTVTFSNVRSAGVTLAGQSATKK